MNTMSKLQIINNFYYDLLGIEDSMTNGKVNELTIVVPKSCYTKIEKELEVGTFYRTSATKLEENTLAFVGINGIKVNIKYNE